METTASLILGVYVISLSLTMSEGPYGLFYKLRQIKKVDDFGLLNCFMCTAFWVAFLLCLITGHMSTFLFVWGLAVIIERVAK